MKKALAALFALLLCLLLVSCGSGEDPTEAANEFLRRLNAGEYESAYAMLTEEAMENISEEEFVEKYGNIFSGLGITDILLSEASSSETPLYTTYQYIATYVTAEYGDITKQFSMNLTLLDGEWRVEWTPALIFPEMTWGDSVYARVLKAERGEIFSKDGTLIAGNQYGSTVYVDRTQIEDLDAYCAQIAPILEMPAEDVKKCFERTTANVVTLKSYQPGSLEKEREAAILAVEHTGIDTSSFTLYRVYPLKEAFFHLVGYTGPVTEDELAAMEGTEREGLYDGDSIIGKTGLEKVYEDELRGTDGYEVYISGENGKINLIEPVPAVDGNDLWLTIDARDQMAAYDMLRLYLREEEGGSIVQIDPKTGAVQVMVSYPSVDPNLFVAGISSTDYAYLLSDVAYQPLFNRCTQGLYPPGSIVKPFTAIAAMEGGAITADSVFPYTIVNNQWRPDRSDWFYPAITRTRNRGDSCNLYNSLIYSDNIYFAWAAMELGQEKFVEFFEEKLLWGESVPFDLSVAQAQILNEGTEWNIKYLADSGYGQGEMLITPLQAALIYCSLSNESGEIYEPYVIASRGRSVSLYEYETFDETQPVLWTAVEYDSGARGAIETALEDVTEVGTARSLDPPYKMAGKTGTAEVGAEKEREIGWLAVYKDEGARDSVMVITADTPVEKSSVKLQIGHYLLNDEMATDASDAALTGAGSAGQDEPQEEE